MAVSANTDVIVDIVAVARITVYRRPWSVKTSVPSLEADTARGAAGPPISPSAPSDMHCRQFVYIHVYYKHDHHISVSA